MLKRREFGLELKRRDRARALTDMVEFIALKSPFPSKLKIWSFQSWPSYAETAKKCRKKRAARAELLLFFLRSRCRRRCSFVRSLMVLRKKK